MLRGVSPDGRHYYPAFPYASFVRMQPGGRRRPLGLPADPAGGRGPGARPRPRASPSTSAAASASGSSPFSPTRPPSTLDAADPRSRAASIWSKAPATAASATRRATSPAPSTTARWLGGAPAPEGKGRVPNITARRRARRLVRRATSPTSWRPASPPTSTPSAARWSRCRRTSRCSPATDRDAIAAYLKAVPPQAAEAADGAPAESTRDAALPRSAFSAFTFQTRRFC